MAALISFFIVLLLSLIIVRFGTVMLRLTGLSSETARFQARSAFTGTGFTTHESELVVNHPVRRRIILTLMLLRNVGFISFISSLILSFINTNTSREILLRVAILAAGLLFFWIIASLRLVDRILTRVIQRALKKWTGIRAGDYESLLSLSGEYEVIEGEIKEESWFSSQSIERLKLTDEGILVLGVRRSYGGYIGIPQGKTVLDVGDRIVLYGKEESLQGLLDRPAGEEGDEIHRKAAESYRGMLKKTGPLQKKKSGFGRFISRIFRRK